MGTRIILAVVTPTEDVSLQCTTSLLRLQQSAASKTDVSLDFHIVSTLLEALNLYTKGDVLLVVDGQCSVSSEFVFGGLDKPCVLGIYPLAKVDWERVAKTVTIEGSQEPPGHTGNVYNVVPQASTMSRYVLLQQVLEAKVLMIKTEEIQKIVGPHTQYDQNKHLLCHDSVFEGIHQNQYQTFLRKLQCPVVGDLQEQCTLSGSAQFAGCVGMRGFVR